MSAGEDRPWDEADSTAARTPAEGTALSQADTLRLLFIPVTPFAAAT